MGLFSSKQKSKQTVTPYNQGQLDDILSRLRTWGQTPLEMYPEQTYADLSPEQEAALQGRMGVAEGFGGGIMDPTRGAWESTLTAPDVANNPYVNQMLDVQRGQAMEALREDVMPMIRSRAAGVGGLGGSRQGVVETNAIEDTMDALASAQAQTQLGAYGQGLGQQRYGIGAAPGMAALELTPSDIMMGVGDIRRGEEQRGIDEAMARHEFAQMEPYQRAQMQANLYHPLASPYAARESTSKTTPSGMQIAGQIGSAALMAGLGAGALGFGPAAGMFSGAGAGAAGAGAAGAGAAGAGGGIMNAAAGNMAANYLTGGGGGYGPFSGMMLNRYAGQAQM